MKTQQKEAAMSFSNSKLAAKIRALARLTRRQRAGAIPERRGLMLRDERGQATSESAVLLLSTLLTIVGTGTYLLHSHSDWLNALSSHIHGFYFVLSLPFP